MKPMAGIPVLDRLTADEANLRVAACLDDVTVNRLEEAAVEQRFLTKAIISPGFPALPESRPLRSGLPSLDLRHHP